VSYHTVNRYADILEQTFLIRKLPPFFANVRKRLVKSPKVYFRDTGLLHYFLGIREETTLDTHPARGASWEAFILDQLVSAFQRYAPGSQAFFWRTAQGDEADLLVDTGRMKVAYEVKLHSAPTAHDARGLYRCMQDLGLSRGYLVYPGATDYSLGSGITALSASRLLSKARARVRP
jgi:predicted AAA+ superfamily ATPase